MITEAVDEGRSCYRVDSPTATYFFDKAGGGFTSILDPDGTDWIGYRRGGGSAGEYRGIPNTGQLHPGYDNAVTTTATALGEPVPEVTIETSRAGFGATWVFRPSYAEMTLHTVPAGQTYWLLYEGTPGGAVDKGDRLVLSNGRDYSANEDHPWGRRRKRPDLFTDIAGDSTLAPGSEWGYIAASESDRSLFFAHTDDEHEDDYWQMNDEMTVFGFGRTSSTKKLMTMPGNRLVIGLAASRERSVVGSTIHRAWTAAPARSQRERRTSRAPASQEERQIAPVVAYDFSAGHGAVIRDRARRKGLDLVITDTNAVTWITHGIRIEKPTLISSIEPASQLTSRIAAQHAITVEAWVRPANANQFGPARIVSLARDPYERNATLGQEKGGYSQRLRTTRTDKNGTRPSVATRSGVDPRRPTHVVYTRDADGTACLYVNGKLLASAQVPGDLSNWDASYRLGLANELTGDRPWLGELYAVAIYAHALRAATVRAKHRAGHHRTPRPASPKRTP
jgi:hypothetical protein